VSCLNCDRKQITSLGTLCDLLLARVQEAILSPTWSLTDVCGSLDILPAAHPKRTTTVLSLRWSGGCLQIGSDRREDLASPGFVQWRQTLANRTLALHLPGGRQRFVTTGGALWTQQCSSGVCYKREEEESAGGQTGWLGIPRTSVSYVWPTLSYIRWPGHTQVTLSWLYWDCPLTSPTSGRLGPWQQHGCEDIPCSWSTTPHPEYTLDRAHHQQGPTNNPTTITDWCSPPQMPSLLWSHLQSWPQSGSFSGTVHQYYWSAQALEEKTRPAETDLVTNYREWSTATQSGSGDSSTACSEQNSLADTRGNGYVTDKLRMMMTTSGYTVVDSRYNQYCTRTVNSSLPYLVTCRWI